MGDEAEADYRVTIVVRLLLGPQQRRPTFDACVADLAPRGRLLLVTAGWREREADDAYIRRRLPGREVENLGLHGRAEAVLEAQPDVAEVVRGSRERLLELQRLYRRRLDHGLAAVRELQRLEEDGDVLEMARNEAIDAVRELDRHHLEHVARVRVAQEAALASAPPALQRQCEELVEAVESAAAVLVAGGPRAGTLLECLELFGMRDALQRVPLVAWSAGAMVLCERIVLFHDRPPWGAGNAECLGHGLTICRGVQPLPHARQRLRLRDRRRVERLVRRCAPALCLGLDDDSMARCEGGSWQVRSVTQLLPDGFTSRHGADDWEELGS